MLLHNEQRRLAFLHSLSILDSPPEAQCDRITRLLCRVLDVPIAWMSLVDEHRQWFKSARGVDFIETPRAESFCSTTILSNETLIVPDARLDLRFKHLPMVSGDPHVVFYAGCPIRLANDANLGALCVVDTKPRQLSPDDVQFLNDVCQTIANELKARLFKDVYGQYAQPGVGHD